MSRRPWREVPRLRDLSLLSRVDFRVPRREMKPAAGILALHSHEDGIVSARMRHGGRWHILVGRRRRWIPYVEFRVVLFMGSGARSLARQLQANLSCDERSPFYALRVTEYHPTQSGA